MFCRHNLKIIIPPGRPSIKNLKPSSVHYTGNIFELCEADHRAIMESIDSSDMGSHEVEKL
eukprot:1444248-Pleurochrysis_carterae.AAC.1